MAAGYPDWTRALRLLGIDPDGVTLRTVGLDDQGRITAYMADDESQWGDVVKVGNAELAARLGSPATYDWRGKIVAMVDFSRGLGGIYTDTVGAGASVALDPTNFASGGYSLKMTGGSDAIRVANVFMFFNIPPTDRAGFSINWASDSSFDYLTMWLRVYDGSFSHTAKVRYDRDNAQLEYMDDQEAWQTLATHREYSAPSAWHSLKIVVDAAADTYVRCLAGRMEYDMSAFGMLTSISLDNPRLEAVVRLFSHTGENEYIWLDSLIVTVGEPA